MERAISKVKSHVRFVAKVLKSSSKFSRMKRSTALEIKIKGSVENIGDFV